MKNLGTTPLEIAVIQQMLADPQCNPSRRALASLVLLEVEERSVNEVGFITSFVRNTAAKFFGDTTSMRWGNVAGRLNGEVDVDFVVYVDHGYVTGVEGVTFGGEPWPLLVDRFELTAVTDR